MRYAIQLMVMLGDIVFWAAMAILGYLVYENIQNVLVLPVFLLLGFLAFRSWKRYGFIAWKRENIKSFLTNAKKLGL